MTTRDAAVGEGPLRGPRGGWAGGLAGFVYAKQGLHYGVRGTTAIRRNSIFIPR